MKRKGKRKLTITHTHGPILQAQAPEAEPRHRARRPRAQVCLVSGTGRQVDLLNESQVRSKLAGTHVRICPSIVVIVVASAAPGRGEGFRGAGELGRGQGDESSSEWKEE